MAITHTKVSAVADGGDTDLVRPVDWNADHTGQPTSISDFLDDTAGGTDALTTKAPTSNVMYDHGVATTGVHAFGKSCRVRNSANISIPNATETILTWDTEIWDTDTIHDLETNTNRLTCKTAGIYLVFLYGAMQANATGQRRFRIYKNAGIEVQYVVGKDGDGNFVAVVMSIVSLAVNEYMQAGIYQTSGGALNFNASGIFAMARIAQEEL